MINFITIKNDSKLTAVLSPYGATLVSLRFPDNDGQLVECALGFDSIEGYHKDNAWIGRTVGRVANRIKNARFEFKGETLNVPANMPPHCNHGGPNGLSHRVWDLIRSSPTSVTFRIVAKEKDDGFPGEVAVEVTYTVNDRHQLVVEHFATCEKDSVLALTHHGYWNLDGSTDVSNHMIQVNAHEYHPTDDTCCATGSQLSVKSTKFDLHLPKTLSIFRDDEGAVDVDHDFVLEKTQRPSGASCLSLWSKSSGIKMDISTSYPAIHLYGGKYLDAIGHHGFRYGPSKGIAIEAQFHSCALNFDHFPSLEIKAGETYCKEIIYTFSHLEEQQANGIHFEF